MGPAAGAGDDVWVVVPMLDEGRVVGEVVHALRESFRHVVCVDDGSTDDSAAVAAAAGAKVVRHPANLGQGAALQTGFLFVLEHPQAAYVVTFDADGQHSVGDAVRLVGIARETGVDVVLGSRFLDTTPEEIAPSRRALLRLATRVTRWTTGLAVSDTHNGLRVLSRRALERMELTLDGMAHASQLLDRVAEHELSWVEAPVSIAYTEYSRARGQSNANALNIAWDLVLERLRGRG